MISSKSPSLLWQIPFFFLIFVAPLSTSLSELTKGVFLLFLIIAFFVKEKRKQIFAKSQKTSFLFKLVVAFFIVHFITLILSGFNVSYWGDSKIGIINHFLGVFLPHVIVFFYSYFFFRLETFKKIFLPFLFLVIVIVVFSLVNFWQGKTNLPMGIYGKLTTHSRLVAIYFTVIFSVVVFSMKGENFLSIKKKINVKKVILFLLVFVSVVLLLIEFKNSFSRSLLLFLFTLFIFYLFHFLNWKKLFLILPLLFIFGWVTMQER